MGKGKVIDITGLFKNKKRMEHEIPNMSPEHESARNKYLLRQLEFRKKKKFEYLRKRHIDNMTESEIEEYLDFRLKQIEETKTMPNLEYYDSIHLKNYNKGLKDEEKILLEIRKLIDTNEIELAKKELSKLRGKISKDITGILRWYRKLYFADLRSGHGISLGNYHNGLTVIRVAIRLGMFTFAEKANKGVKDTVNQYWEPTFPWMFNNLNHALIDFELGKRTKALESIRSVKGFIYDELKGHEVIENIPKKIDIPLTVEMSGSRQKVPSGKDVANALKQMMKNETMTNIKMKELVEEVGDEELTLLTKETLNLETALFGKIIPKNY